MTAPRIAVVGGGAAGIIAGSRASELGARVTLFEKNERPGMKILISGGGKCNLTHQGSMEEIRAQFRTPEARFLKPSFYRYTNHDFLEILHSRGMRTYTRPDGRIFPVEPANAKDVVSLLSDFLKASGVEFRPFSPCSGLVVKDGQISGIKIGDKVITADKVILCTGGSSYPATGTTGDGWRWLSEIGHTIEPLRAALAPLYLQSAKPEWSGVAIRDTILRARTTEGGKALSSWRGDLLFTHKGVSGPCALGISREIAERMAVSSELPIVEVDLVPDKEYEEIRESLRKLARDNPRKTLTGLVSEIVVDRLIEPVVSSIGISGDTRLAHLPAKNANRYASVMKGWSLGPVRSVPLERGEVVAGGVRLDEVDPHTMESRVIKGLYLCGEVLDIAGPVGGYNLQAAWSTGFMAGDSAGKHQPDAI
jgi:predicted Rossmann fold flavoprotein